MDGMRKALPYAALALLYAALILLVRPFGDFPLNDDWAYAWSVQRLLEGGTLRISDWSSPSLVFQVVCGAAWTKLFGSGAFQLRLLTLLFAGAGSAFLGLLAARLTKDRVLAGAAALAMASSPLYLSLSFTFMTDVYFVALFAAALYSYRAARFGAGSAFAAAAVLVRQNGMLIPLGAALAEPKARGRALLLPLAAFVAWALWFQLAHGPTWASRVYVSDGTWRHLAEPGFLAEAARRLGAGLVYGGLFAAPLALAARGERKDWVLAAAAALVAWRAPLPYHENLFGPHGLGTVSIPSSGFFDKEAGVFAQAWLWRVLTFAGAFSAARAALSWRREFAWPTALLFLSGLAGARYYDRYTLVLLPGALLAAALLLRERGFSKPILAASLACQCALSIVGTADYFRYSEAKWELARSCRGEVDGGFDWNGSRFYQETTDELKKSRPLEAIGEWDWVRGRSFTALVSFSPLPGGRRKKLLATKSYATPLATEPARLYLWGL